MDWKQRFMASPRVRWAIATTLLLLVAVGTVLGADQGQATLVSNSDQPTGKIYYVASNGDDTNDGSLEQPWASVNHAANTLQAGETVYIRGGVYALYEAIQPRNSGTVSYAVGDRPRSAQEQPITYAAFPGEHVVLDARWIEIPAPSGEPPFAHDQGAFLLENVEHIRVRELEIINSHNAGFTVRNSRYIQLYNNKTTNTFSSGIAVWDGHHHQIIGNTVINANLPRLASFERDPRPTPHEAISLGGARYFEVAYNEVAYSRKEGIDVKEASQHGTVHHNYVYHTDRQGLYVDGWYDTLEDIEIFDNVVHDCGISGFAISSEDGTFTRNIRVHHNLFYDNWGTGIFLSRWGKDGPRRDIEIYNNTVYHNGYGPPNPGEEFFWVTGGIYLFSTELEDINIHHNIFSQNTGFQIGYSDRYLQTAINLDSASNPESTDIKTIFRQKGIRISDNLIDGKNDPRNPVYAGWPSDNYADIYGFAGEGASAQPPPFVNARRGSFWLQTPINGADGAAVGALPAIDADAPDADTPPQFWWKTDFPPTMAFAPY